MTSEVTIKAHCANTKVVHAVVRDGHDTVEEFVLHDGESRAVYVYDNRSVSVREEWLAATPKPASE